MKLLEEMTPEEMLGFLEETDRQAFTNGILDFSNEYDFSDDLLIDVLTAVEYLNTTIPNTEQMFARLVKNAEIELTNRLGVLPRKFISPS